MLRKGEKNSGPDGSEMSLYRRFLLNKYPQMTFKNYQSLSQNLENLKKKRMHMPQRYTAPSTGIEETAAPDGTMPVIIPDSFGSEPMEDHIINQRFQDETPG